VVQCGRGHCAIAAVVPPATAAVFVHVYLTDVQSQLGFIAADGSPVAAQTCRPRVAGPMVRPRHGGRHRGSHSEGDTVRDTVGETVRETRWERHSEGDTVGDTVGETQWETQ
jgi:hypothetical protein